MDVFLPILGNSAASYVINKLIDAATTYLQDQYYWKTDLQEELRNLKNKLPQIQAVVGFAEQSLTLYEASNPALMEWLWQFRDRIDEAEEVLDELKYHELEKKPDSDKSIFSRAVNAANIFWKSDPILEILRTCVKNLNTSASSLGDFLELVKHAGGIGTGQMEILPLTNQSRITSPLPLPALSFKGREEEKRKIFQYLLGESVEESEIQRSQNVHCLPLVAMGGMGKTALAQQVFDHFENVKKKHFDIQIWVCVSTDFNASSLMKKILEYSTGQPESGPWERIPVKLKEMLQSKRFLLVLDDAWDDKKQTEWEKLCAPLLYGQKGSWILLTTRLRSVAKMVSKEIRGTMEPMMLPGLSKDECRSLLYEHAFVGQNPNEFPLLKKIGDEIVEKLDGVPLLAKSIGGALNSQLKQDHWMRISRSQLWTMSQDSRDGFIPALTLSYEMLPPELKRCFSYCGIFPQDYQFDKQKLVCMWVTAGLIYSDGSGGSDEDMANDYFDKLCNKSFFDVHTKNYWRSSFYEAEEDIYYTMHDMLNGLACHVSRYECCRIVDVPPSSISNSTRHIFISITSRDAQPDDVANMVCKLEHLRTLWIQYDEHPRKLDDFIRRACKSPRRIRVLIIKSGQCFESNRDFVKLRFLDISGHFQPLWSICKFYFLQVLIGTYSNPIILAEDTSKLTNLRHLYGVKKNALHSIAEVGKLTSLQELCFSVDTRPGYRIDELMNMANLHKLSIKRLSNVRSLDEANNVNLASKSSLTRLRLGWGKVRSNPDDLDQQDVLSALRPPHTIRELLITDYNGGRLASWTDTSCLSLLESLELYDCTSLEELPPLWKLPCLKFLKLDHLEAIKRLGCDSSGQMDKQFPVLEKLVFRYLTLLEVWNGADDCVWFPRLKSFEIVCCPKLKKIPDLPLSIENLDMFDLGLEALTWSYRCSNGSKTFGGFQLPMSLESLEIFNCPGIVQIGLIDEEDDNLLPSSLKKLKLGCLTSLQKSCFSVGTESGYRIDESMIMNDLHQLKIKEANKLNLVRKRNLTRFSWLESVELCNCISLKELPPLWKLPCLKFLRLSRMEAIKSLGCHSSDRMDIQFPVLEKLEFCDLLLWEEWNGADDYVWFPLLKSFEIDNCPKLKKIPDLPLSVENLKMGSLSLEALPRSYRCSNGFRTFGGFQQLTSLESLEIYDYLIIGEENDNLLPSSLKTLRFLGRPKFLSIEVESQEFLKDKKRKLSIEVESQEFLKDKKRKLSIEVESQEFLKDKKRKRAVSSSSVFDHSASDKTASILPSSLQSLIIDDSDISQESLGRCLQGLISLEVLCVSGCRNLVSLSNTEYLRNLTALRTLSISRCEELRELKLSTALVSLRKLFIDKCPKLLASTTEQRAIQTGTLPSLKKIGIDSIFYLPILPTPERPLVITITSENPLVSVAEFTCFPSEIEEWLQCPESLEELILGHMPHLQSLPASLESFSSLKILRISSAPELQSLPRMPASLKVLTINECSATLEERCQETIGSDWPNIKHIPFIDISQGEPRYGPEQFPGSKLVFK